MFRFPGTTARHSPSWRSHWQLLRFSSWSIERFWKWPLCWTDTLSSFSTPFIGTDQQCMIVKVYQGAGVKSSRQLLMFPLLHEQQLTQTFPNVHKFHKFGKIREFLLILKLVLCIWSWSLTLWAILVFRTLCESYRLATQQLLWGRVLLSDRGDELKLMASRGVVPLVTQFSNYNSTGLACIKTYNLWKHFLGDGA